MSSFDMLDESDRAVVLEGIVGSTGPEGMAEVEIVRQVEIVAAKVVLMATDAALLGMIRRGEVRLFADEVGVIQIGLTEKFHKKQLKLAKGRQL